MKYIEFDESRIFDIIALGRVAVDFNPEDYYKTIAESTKFIKYVGGSPANTVVGLSRLGKKCGFIGCVSADRLGEFVTGFMENEGIDTSKIVLAKNGEKIGLTFTEILSPEESSILMYRNCIADLQLSVEDVNEEYISTAKALLISGTALSESPSREAALKAMLLAKRTNTPIIFDIDYRSYNWKNSDEISIYYSIVGKEASIILGSREEYDLMEYLIRPGMSNQETAAYWQGHKAKIVIIKHGKEGSTAYTTDGKQYTIKPFPIKKLKSFGGETGMVRHFCTACLKVLKWTNAWNWEVLLHLCWLPVMDVVRICPP